MEDDKRFIRSDNDDSKEKEERKRIPIPLPEIEYPSPKEGAPAEKEPPKKEAPPPPPPPPPPEEPEPEEAGGFEPPKEREAAGPLRKPWIFIISIFILGLSIFGNMLLYYNGFYLKKDLESKAKLIRELTAEKDKIVKEKGSLGNDIERIKGELVTAESASQDLKEQNASFETELAGYEEKYAQLEGAIGDYTKEIEELSESRIKYYNAYVKEKGNATKLSGMIKDLEGEVEALKAKTDYTEEKYKDFKDREASYLSDIAFLYVMAGMFDEAIENFKKYLVIKGDDANTYYNLGYVYEHGKKERAEAINHYNKYLELEPYAEDLYEVKMKIASLERSGPKESVKNLNTFKIDLDKLKY